MLAKIASIELSAAWQARTAPSGAVELLSFSLKSDDSVQLNLFYRGKSLNPIAAERFKVLLEQAPHLVEATQLRSVEMVLRDASEPEYFQCDSARTIFLAGKTVLQVDGLWTQNQLRSRAYFADRDGDGKTVSEIHYLAPLSIFEQHLAEVESFLLTVSWVR
jgi:hypothetical protein